MSNRHDLFAQGVKYVQASYQVGSQLALQRKRLSAILASLGSRERELVKEAGGYDSLGSSDSKRERALADILAEDPVTQSLRSDRREAEYNIYLGESELKFYRYMARLITAYLQGGEVEAEDEPA